MNMPAKPAVAPGLASRHAAFSMLARVLDKRQTLDQAMPEDFNALAPSDRAFVLLLVKTVLRRKGQIDALLSQWLTQPLDETPPAALHLLRLGVAQLLWLETPPHAAVHSTVELAKSTHQAGLVNAILQRCVREGKALAETQEAAKLFLPGWLWQRWSHAYGEAQAQRMAEASMREAPLDLTVKSDAAGWAEKLDGTALNEQSVRLENGGDITKLYGFDLGEWWVQDAAAALPAQRLLEDLGETKGKLILDLCAAPGGKTAQLCAAGANVTALDISAARMKRVRENLARLNLQAECVVADALKWQPPHAPDAILLDAPCSATGTLRRHPEIPFLRTPQDIARLVATQAKLLHRAISWLKPGGVLVYSVCSLEKEEGEAQLRALQQAFPALTLLREERTLPHEAEADGFYLFVVRV